MQGRSKAQVGQSDFGGNKYLVKLILRHWKWSYIMHKTSYTLDFPGILIVQMVSSFPLGWSILFLGTRGCRPFKLVLLLAASSLPNMETSLWRMLLNKRDLECSWQSKFLRCKAATYIRPLTLDTDSATYHWLCCKVILNSPVQSNQMNVYWKICSTEFSSCVRLQYSSMLNYLGESSTELLFLFLSKHAKASPFIYTFQRKFLSLKGIQFYFLKCRADWGNLRI